MSGHPGPGPAPSLIPAVPDQSWLELFYDLAFAASIVVLSSTYSSYAGVGGVIWLGLVFSMIWSTWLSTTLMLGAGLVTTMWTRALLLTQMVLVLSVAITSDYSQQDHSAAVGPLFAAVLVTLALLYRSARRSAPGLDVAYRGHATRCVVASSVFLLVPFLGWPWWYPLLWIAGISVFMLPTRSQERRLPMDSHHVVHRFGEFTIIMLGEVFLKLGITASQEPLDRVDLIGLPLAATVVFGVWWLYFTDVPAMGLSADHSRRLAWIHLHFPLHLCVIASAVALAHTLVPHPDQGDHATPTVSTIRYIVVPIAVVLVSIGMIGVYSGGPTALVRRRARVFLSAAAALVLAEAVLLGFNSPDLEASAFIVTVVLAVTALCIRRIRVPTVGADGVE